LVHRGFLEVPSSWSAFKIEKLDLSSSRDTSFPELKSAQ
jgi:hypothetical protein